MKLTVCELPDDPAAMDAAWDHLERTLKAEPTDVLVLPEFAGVSSFWTRPTFDAHVWREAVALQAQLPERFARLAARRVLGSRVVEVDGRRLNQSFLWTPTEGFQAGRAKAWLPQEEGAWEETWFDRGEPLIEPTVHEGLSFATLMCTEVVVSHAPWPLGHAGVQLIAVPRTTGGHRRWEVATQMAAILSGAFVASANRRGDDFAGGSWIVDPDGTELARTDAHQPVVTIEVDLAQTHAARGTYPRNIADPFGTWRRAP
ncbi:carbon-nitrogen hydrolase family protein [Trinickia fusca]|uniref:Carbon-nitrogen hydrolase family protein n=1 Tax=Trinickia fusca TaxID=2419777 RepID=A0A494XSF9_9BURK|nr:carbon-nitrogen hydrolase family protein [Trinickia fusca]RKP52752.1 carbon-nitrogen hydrolase family protein [Trinickia fusca]